MSLEDGEKLAITSAKTAFGDLFAKGIVSLKSVMWEGEFENASSGPRFKAGYSYQEGVSKLHFMERSLSNCNY